MAHTVKNPPAGDQGLIPGLGKVSGEGNGYPPEFLSGEFHGQRSLAGYSPWGRKESDTTEQQTLSLSCVKYYSSRSTEFLSLIFNRKFVYTKVGKVLVSRSMG